MCDSVFFIVDHIEHPDWRTAFQIYNMKIKLQK